MHVLVNSHHHITGDERMTEIVESLVEDALGRFGERITRVEVHLSDVNGDKLGERDKRCMMEARVAGLKPVAVSHQAATIAEAMEAAADKLERAIDRVLGKLEDRAGRGPTDEQVASLQEVQERADSERTQGKPTS